MINYTFIIPHKNTPTLLQRCIDSIPLRDDIEIIIIDDNSDPKIVNFQYFPGVNRSDVDIHFLKEEKGAGYARNIGLDYAKGKWILFADADDFFIPNFICIIDEYKNSDNDLIYFRHKQISSETLEENLRDLWFQEVIYAYNKNIISLRYLSSQLLPPWAKMIRHETMIKYIIKFNEVKYANDIVCGARQALLSNIAFCNENIYYLTSRHNSLTKVLTSEALWIRYKEAYKMNQVFRKYRCSKLQHSMRSYFYHFAKKCSFTQLVLVLIRMTIDGTIYRGKYDRKMHKLVQKELSKQ